MTLNKARRYLSAGVATTLLLASSAAIAFESGSTGSDLAFAPTVNTQLQLPPDGVFNFTDVDIPAGVTVTFARNATNTPVTILASGNVTIAGTIDLSGKNSTDAGAAGDGNLGDDGIPGVGGAGGFDGGRGAPAPDLRGGDGLGPGGGSAPPTILLGGGGGGFGTVGGAPRTSGAPTGGGGPIYGSSALLPLIGGSGGAGGSSDDSFGGSGGGGGGGAILIAASGTVDLTGSILSNGGRSGNVSGPLSGGPGGGGSGGGIRIVATTISGNGTIRALGAGGGTGISSRLGGAGGTGRIRLEADNFLRQANSSPAFVFSAPDTVFVAGLPTLSITSVAGVPAPAQPTGNADIALPSATPNPVAVDFATTGVPVGNTVTLKVIPANAAPVIAVSDALVGSEASATASATVDLPDGPSVLSATVSFTVTASAGDAMRRFAEGERVERVVLAAAPSGRSTTTLVTVSGKQFAWPSSALPRIY